MSPEAFISSGTIEQVLLGAATPEEEAEMWRMAENHPEIAAEIAAVEETMAAFAQAQAVTPALDWAVIDAVTEGVAQDPAPASADPVAPEEPAPTGPGRAGNAALKLARMRAWAVGATILLLGALVGLFLVWSEWSTSRQQLETARVTSNELGATVDSCATANQALDSLQMLTAAERDFAVAAIQGIARDGYVPIFLAKNNAAAAEAMALYDPDQQRVQFYMETPEQPSLREYVLWVINGNTSQPENLDVYELDAFFGGTGWIDVADLNPVAFAISSEENPSTTTPTDIYNVGAVAAP